ncbi:unnamed protein product [Rotaria sp. Silwood2]|nr:unnamed protein product [Rotaria sp. Silwood2]CAF2525520.1 unnamed protein product [Rotaria sp. Silwood2]CAF2802924.1 unnamed protein product [Rotaria sp. Silwood2]CAF2960219.1 unnamed protein product [Rotaria sp. Silwood2]CAF3859872.1 unnamed protein product [Rotaria sp. Silwood2]
MLRQASLLYRVYHPNVIRQTLVPLSTSTRYLAESTSTGASINEPSKENATERKSYDSVPVHLGSLAKVVMVLGGLYGRYRDVPDSIPNRVYQRTKDRFRARCVVASVFGTGLLAFIAATRGKNAAKEGKRYTDTVYDMHRGESRLHEKLELAHNRGKRSERYSPTVDEINK